MSTSIVHIEQSDKVTFFENASNVFDDIYAYYQDSDDADSPVISDIDDDGVNKGKKKRAIKYPRYNANLSNGGVELQVGLEFINKEQLRGAIEDYRIMKGYDIRIQHSDTKRFQAFCNAKGCEWSLWASIPKCKKSFQIRKMPKPHSCVPFSFERGKRKISSRWLSYKYMETLRLQPSLKMRELRDLIEFEHNYKPTMSMCFRVRAKALALILGDYKTQFSMLRAYANELLNKNNESTVKIDVQRNGDEECVFKSLYICLGPLKRGFLDGCRRVLSIDACFIKGPWNGQILAVVGRDANNQMYPVAWGVAQKEDRETWLWFMEFLANDLHMDDGDGWTIISDQQKGLVDAISNQLPKVEHRLCARHVYADLRKKWKGLQYRDVFWKIAKSCNQVDYSNHVKEMQDLDVDAWKFLERKGPEHFCRLFFKPYAKCDSVDNNMAEIFNASIIDERFMPIWTMLDGIFKKVMTRVGSRKQMADRLQQEICPAILKKLEKAKNLSRWWQARGAGNGMYSVTHGSEGFVVDIIAKTCTCQAWELSGIPCCHALAVMREEKMNPTQFVDKCYKTSMLKKTYAHTLKPINGPNLWSPCESEPIIAPVFNQKKRANYKFKRRPEEGETRSRGQYGAVPKSGGTVRCSICQEYRHNKKTCRQRSSVNASSSGGVAPPPTSFATHTSFAPVDVAIAPIDAAFAPTYAIADDAFAVVTHDASVPDIFPVATHEAEVQANADPFYNIVATKI